MGTKSKVTGSGGSGGKGKQRKVLLRCQHCSAGMKRKVMGSGGKGKQ